VNAPASTYATNQGYGYQNYQNYGYGNNYNSSGYGYSAAPIGSNFVTTDTIASTTSNLRTPYASNLLQQNSMNTLPMSSTLNSSVPAVIVEKRENAPVVHERIRREEVEEIQPVIHREREKTEVHKITQPIFTNSTTGIITEERSLPAQYSEFRTPSMPVPMAALPSSTESLAAQKFRIEKAPVVYETQKTKVVEEIQPVVYKEVVQPHITRWTQPIYEHIVEADTYVTETLPARSQFYQQQFPMQGQQLGHWNGQQLGQWNGQQLGNWNQQFGQYNGQQFNNGQQLGQQFNNQLGGQQFGQWNGQQQQILQNQQLPLNQQWQNQQLPIKSQQFPLQGNQQLGQQLPIQQQSLVQQPMAQQSILQQQPMAQQSALPLQNQLPAVVQQPINNILKDKLGFPLNPTTSTTAINPIATNNNLLNLNNTPTPLASF
jgi:hypothetical protein